MTLTEYRTHIACATRAADLHELSGLATLDGQLTPGEQAAVRAAVGSRFAQLNAAALGTPKPRWSAPVRIPTAARTR